MTQDNMFSDNNDDLPLFSGTRQRADRQQFAPGQAARQLHLPEVCTNCGAQIDSRHRLNGLVDDVCHDCATNDESE